MARTRIYEGTFPTAPRPVALRVYRGTRPTRGTMPGRRRPAWSVLYAIALLSVGGAFAADVVLPEGLARTLAQLSAVASGVALIRLWIGCNRWRIVQAEKQDNPTSLDDGVEVSSIQEVQQ